MAISLLDQIKGVKYKTNDSTGFGLVADILLAMLSVLGGGAAVDIISETITGAPVEGTADITIELPFAGTEVPVIIINNNVLTEVSGAYTYDFNNSGTHSVTLHLITDMFVFDDDTVIINVKYT